jgi:Tol biopolymer transport system component
VALERTSTPTRNTPAPQTVEPSKTFTLTQTFTATEVLLPTMTPTLTGTVAPTATLMGGGYSQLAFAGMKSGVPQIFLVMFTADGKTEQTQLTDLAEGACQPDFSPDGQFIVFISPCKDRLEEYRGARLNVINADGSGLMTLPSSEAGDFDPAWSPDGKSIAFTSLRDGLNQIYLMALPDYTVTQLTRKSEYPSEPDWSRQPAWSPDGSQILYTGHSRLSNALQIWVMHSDGAEQKLVIARGPNYWDFSPDWSADGKTIMFNETNGAQKLGWSMVFDYEHRATAQIIHLRSGLYSNHGRFSPDGLWMTYEGMNVANVNDPNYYIFYMKVEAGHAPIRINTKLPVNFDPVWRPIK